jgi:Flp pilus assembly pilin Flp
MTPSSKIRSSGRSSRKRETGQTVAEYAIVLTVITISVAALLVILSGGVSVAIERVVELM